MTPDRAAETIERLRAENTALHAELARAHGTITRYAKRLANIEQHRAANKAARLARQAAKAASERQTEPEAPNHTPAAQTQPAAE